MTIEEALKMIQQVCASVQATLEVHQKIQEALKIITESVKPQS